MDSPATASWFISRYAATIPSQGASGALLPSSRLSFFPSTSPQRSQLSPWPPMTCVLDTWIHGFYSFSCTVLANYRMTPVEHSLWLGFPSHLLSFKKTSYHHGYPESTAAGCGEAAVVRGHEAAVFINLNAEHCSVQHHAKDRSYTSAL